MDLERLCFIFTGTLQTRYYSPHSTDGHTETGGVLSEPGLKPKGFRPRLHGRVGRPPAGLTAVPHSWGAAGVRWGCGPTILFSELLVKLVLPPK